MHSFIHSLWKKLTTATQAKLVRKRTYKCFKFPAFSRFHNLQWLMLSSSFVISWLYQAHIQRGGYGVEPPPQKSLHRNFWVYLFAEWPWQLILIHAILASFSVKWSSMRKLWFHDFYRAMHFSAKRGIATHVVCLSVCLSVCNVGELWSHRLEFFRNNFTVS